MKKSFKLDGEKVIIVKELGLKQPPVKGQVVPEIPIVDKDGHWIQVEFASGPNKGNRKPTTKERLTN
jgi:hypothetical protein